MTSQITAALNTAQALLAKAQAFIGP